MKSIIRASLIWCVLCAGAFAQAKPRMAVDVSGRLSPDQREILASTFISLITPSGRFVPVEDQDVFTKIVEQLLSQIPNTGR